MTFETAVDGCSDLGEVARMWSDPGLEKEADFGMADGHSEEVVGSCSKVEQRY